MTPILIAEVKIWSPWWDSPIRPLSDTMALAIEKGDWVSVHVDPLFNGSLGLIENVKAGLRTRKMNKPVLAKGFHCTTKDIDYSLNAGADYALCVGWVPPKRYWGKVLVEAESLTQLSGIPTEVKAVWNKRDPRTGEDRLQTIVDARAVRRGWLCQASGISSRADVCQGVDAILVGEHLEEYE